MGYGVGYISLPTLSPLSIRAPLSQSKWRDPPFISGGGGVLFPFLFTAAVSGCCVCVVVSGLSVVRAWRCPTSATTAEHCPSWRVSCVPLCLPLCGCGSRSGCRLRWFILNIHNKPRFAIIVVVEYTTTIALQCLVSRATVYLLHGLLVLPLLLSPRTVPAAARGSLESGHGRETARVRSREQPTLLHPGTTHHTGPPPPSR